MQFKFFASLALATLAAASPSNLARHDKPASQCNTGDLQCCNSVTTANSSAASAIIALLGIVVQDPTTIVGLTCSPITAIGVSGSSCTAQPVCCNDNSYNGVIAIGCVTVNINL